MMLSCCYLMVQRYYCLRTQEMFYDKKGYKGEYLLTYIKEYRVYELCLKIIGISEISK
jgi:hypothetical protein